MDHHVGIGEGRIMDRLFKSNWFVKIISFLIALMLYTVVSSEEHPSQAGGGAIKQNEITLKEQLNVKYDENKYVVTGYPDSVTVQVKGNNNMLTKASLMINRKTFINLNGKAPGTYSAKVETEGFPIGLQVSVVPSTVSVTIEKKITKEIPVSIELFNQDKVADGYKPDDPIPIPDKVEVTGGEKEVNAIAFIKGVVDVKGADGPIDKKVSLNAYDKEGNQVSIDMNPSTVQVQVPVTSPSKSVPINFTTKGSLPDGLVISSIKLNTNHVNIYGPKDKINDMTSLDGLTIPLDNIHGNQTLHLPLPVPSGVEKLDPSTVDVNVKVDKPTTKLFKEMPIDVMGLPDNYDIGFKDPVNRSLDVELKGAPDVLSNIDRKDIELYIDVTGLSAGDQTVKAKLKVPQYVSGKISKQDVQITLSESGSSSGTP